MSKQKTTCWQKWFLWIVKTTVAKSIQKDFYERPLMGELCVETLKILPLKEAEELFFFFRCVCVCYQALNANVSISVYTQPLNIQKTTIIEQLK